MSLDVTINGGEQEHVGRRIRKCPDVIRHKLGVAPPPAVQEPLPGVGRIAGPVS